MSFERRFIDFVLIATVAVLLIGGAIAFAVNFAQMGDDSAILVVKSLNPVEVAPRVSYIPVKKATSRASISNSVLTPRTKNPVIISI